MDAIAVKALPLLQAAISAMDLYITVEDAKAQIGSGTLTRRRDFPVEPSDPSSGVLSRENCHTFSCGRPAHSWDGFTMDAFLLDLRGVFTVEDLIARETRRSSFAGAVGDSGGEGMESNHPRNVTPRNSVLKTGGATGPHPPPQREIKQLARWGEGVQVRLTTV